MECLNLDMTDTLRPLVFFGEDGGYPVHYKTVGSITGLSPLDASSIPSQWRQPGMSPDIATCLLESQVSPTGSHFVKGAASLSLGRGSSCFLSMIVWLGFR